MISIILSIIFYGILGTGTLGIGVGIYSKWGIHGLIDIVLGIFALPSWMFIMYRLFNNVIYAMNNHLKDVGKGLFDTAFIVSIIIVVITNIIEMIHREFYLRKGTNNE